MVHYPSSSFFPNPRRLVLTKNHPYQEPSFSMVVQRKEATQERSANVVKSPREAAMGVATLSGLIENRREKSITATITRPKTGKRRGERATVKGTATGDNMFQLNNKGWATPSAHTHLHTRAQRRLHIHARNAPYTHTRNPPSNKHTHRHIHRQTDTDTHRHKNRNKS